MKENMYLKPLKKYLSEEISPKQLSHLLAELSFDYSQKIVALYSMGDERDIMLLIVK